MKKELKRAIIAQAKANAAVRAVLGEDAVIDGEFVLGDLLTAAGEAQMADKLFTRYMGEAKYRKLCLKYYDWVIDAAMFTLCHPHSCESNTLFVLRFLDLCTEYLDANYKGEFHKLFRFERCVQTIRDREEVEAFVKSL